MIKAAVLYFTISAITSHSDTLLQAARVTALKEVVSLDKVASPLIAMQPKDGTNRPNSLSGIVPGLHIPEYGASLTSTVYLRGLGSRMDNPVMGLYIDGIPVLEKNAYDFDLAGVESAIFMGGPQGTVYGRNSMGGVLSMMTYSPGLGSSIFAEYGTANSLRTGGRISFGNNVISASYRHTDGFFTNGYKGSPADPYDGGTLLWRYEKTHRDGLKTGNTLLVNLSREGGFAYGPYPGGEVSYNDEGSYRRLSVMDGFRASATGQKTRLDASASLQLLADDMLMDQDYTPESIFTLEQKQLIGSVTAEAVLKRASRSASWQPLTGFFGFYRHSLADAPVTFKKDGIRKLILDNANRNIPQDIGYLAISDDEFPVESAFHTGTWNAALFHQSSYRSGRWLLTAGLRLDYEGAVMDYDCTSTLHYRFIPIMKADKAFTLPYSGRIGHYHLELLPRISALYDAAEGFSLYGTISRGLRAGGFNTQIFSDILQNMMMTGLMEDLGVYLDRPMVSVAADDTEYAPETAWNFEAGLRLRREHLAVEASAYRMIVQNQQLTVFPPGMSTGRMMANAAGALSAGCEIQALMNWTNVQGRLSWAFSDARFTSYNDGNADYSGKHIPYSPSHTLYAGITVRAGAFTADAALRGIGPIYWNEENTLVEDFRLSADARVSYTFGRYELYLRGENLTGSAGAAFYFKSMGNEFIAKTKPRAITIGIKTEL